MQIGHHKDVVQLTLSELIEELWVLVWFIHRKMVGGGYTLA